jgi:hypothetical protein
MGKALKGDRVVEFTLSHGPKITQQLLPVDFDL